MTRHNAQGPHNASGRYDGATMGERIAERMDELTLQLGDWEDQAERWQDQSGYVPDYVSDGLQDAYARLETYAHYWGFDC